MAGRAKEARCSTVFVIAVELELKILDRVETDLVDYLNYLLCLWVERDPCI